MSDPVEILLHVPACYREPWHKIELTGSSVARIPFLRVRHPLPISDFDVSTPTGLLAFDGGRAHIHQIDVLGRAVLAVIESEKPRFHRSRTSEGEIVEASGTTISITANDADAVIFGTWDYGEPVESALGRLNEARRILRLPAPVARAFWTRTFIPELPPPQVVLSNVIPVGERRPMTCLGGYDEGGAETPIVIAVGIERIHIVMDHRVYNPKPDLVLFRDRFLEEIEKALAEKRTPSGRTY